MSRPKTKRSRKRRRAPVAELLEARRLLIADPFYSLAETSQPADLELFIDRSMRVEEVVLRDLATEKVVASAPLREIDRQLRIVGSSRNDSLTINIDTRSLNTTFPRGILFEGGLGTDTLLGPNENSRWVISRTNTGNLNERVQFQDVENLTGGIRNEDEFVFVRAGALDGAVDGGAGGFDSVVVEGDFRTVHSIAKDASSGEIILDDQSITYTGLEPVTLVGSVQNLTITGSANDDNITIDSGPVAGQMIVSSPGTMETQIFPVPLTQLTIQGGQGDDQIIVQANDPAFDAHLSLDGQQGRDRIVVPAGASFDAGSGDVRATAEEIEAQPGSSLTTTGDITFAALDAQGSLAVPDDQNTVILSASTIIDGATLTGDNISLSAESRFVSSITNSLASVSAALLATLDANVIMRGNASIAAAGDFAALSETDVNATVTAFARPVLVAETAVAQPNLTSDANTQLLDSAVVNAGGDVTINATSNNIVNTAAQGLNSVLNTGTTVAQPNVTTSADSVLADNASISGSASIDILATTNSNIATRATGIQAGAGMAPPTLAALGLATSAGPFVQAAALAAPNYAPQSRAAITSSGNVVSAGEVNVTTTGNHNVGTVADASTVVGLANNSAAAAFNQIAVQEEAVIGAPGTTVNIAAPAVFVGTQGDQNGTQFRARALSGAAGLGATNVGSLAQNTTTYQSNAHIDDGTTLNLPNGSSVTISANNNRSVDATAEPQGVATIAGGLGAGASSAANLGLNTTTAEIGQNVTINNATDVSVLATGDTTNLTTSFAGAISGNAQVQSSALLAAADSTQASIGAGSIINVPGNVTVDAEHVATSVTRSRSDAAASNAVGPGVSVATPLAVNVGVDQATANIDGTISSGGNISLNSLTDVSNQADSIAGTQGANPMGTSTANLVAAEVAFLQDRTNLYFGSPITPSNAAPVIGTADGQVGNAAAVAADLSISNSGTNVLGGATLTTANGNINVASLSDVDSIANATASNVNNVAGSAAAAAVSVMGANTQSLVAGTINTNALTIRAANVDEQEHSISANAISGAGTSNVGVAGAFAATQAVGITAAIVDSGADLNLNGNLVVEANTDLSNSTDASAAVSGNTIVGQGASVELNGGAFQTLAETRNADIDGASNLNITATGDYASHSTPTAGLSNGSSFPGALSVLMTNYNTIANAQTNGSVSTISNDLNVTANHEHTSQHSATVGSAFQDVGAAAAAAIGVQQGGAQALMGQTIVVGGNTNIQANSHQPMTSTATASQSGAPGTTPNVQTLTDQEINNMIQFLGGPGTSLAVQSLLDSSRAGTADGALGAAAAMTANFDFGVTNADITNTANLNSAGDVLVQATSDQDLSSVADASTVNSAVGVGVASASNIASAATQALIGGVVLAPNVTLRAQLDDEQPHSANAEARSGVGSTDVGVAGAFAQNVSVTLPFFPLMIAPLPPIPGPTGGSHGATVQGTAQLTLGVGGDLNVESEFAGSYSANTVPQVGDNSPYGIGASVAVNAINQSSFADIEAALINNATNINVTSSGEFTLQATADAGATNAANLPAAIAMNYADVNTVAGIDDGAIAANVAGSVFVNADHNSNITHAADTESGVGTVSIGAALALGVSVGGADAHSGLSATIADSISVLADNRTSMNGSSISGQAGARGTTEFEVTEVTEMQAEALLAAAGLGEVPEPIVRALQAVSAETEEGSIGVASAIAGNLDFGRTVARTTSGGVLNLTTMPVVSATGNLQVETQADAHSVEATQGLGIAVAANFDGQLMESSLGGTVTAPTFRVETRRIGINESDFQARAISGAGSSDVGVAGAFAINVSDPFNPGRTIARVEDAAVLTIAPDGDPDNDVVDVNVDYDTNHLAEATSLFIGGNVGIGPSVAINATSHDAIAEIGDATLNNVDTVSVTANGEHTPQTLATAGTLSLGGFNAAVALTGQSNNSIARLNQAANQSALSGDLIVGAEHQATSNTRADSLTVAGQEGIGAAVAAGGPLGGGQAIAGSNMNVAGDVTVLADTIINVEADADAFGAGPGVTLRGYLEGADANTRRQLRRLAELVGVDDYLFPAQQFDPTPALAISIIPNAETIDAANNTISIGSPNSFDAGDAVVYRNNNDDENIGAFTDQTTYFVSLHPSSDSLLRLHATRAQALAGVMAIDLDVVDVPEDRHTLSTEQNISPATAVNEDTNTINIGNLSGLRQGDMVRYSKGDGDDVGGLRDGNVYFVRVNESDLNNIRIELFASRAEAFDQVAGTPIDLDLSGTNGTNHSITRVVHDFHDRRIHFDASANINDERDSIEINSVRGLATGDAVIYRNFGDDGTIGLDDGAQYFVRVETLESGQPRITFHNTFEAANDEAQSPIAISGLDTATGDHGLIPALVVEPEEVSEETGLIDFGGQFGLQDGDLVLYRSDDDAIGNLADDSLYYVVFQYPDNESAWLFDSKEDAQQVIAEKEKPRPSDDQEGTDAKAELVNGIAEQRRIQLDPSQVTGNRHAFERVSGTGVSESPWLPEQGWVATAAIAAGASMPNSSALVGDNASLIIDGELDVTSLLDFQTTSIAISGAFQALGGSAAGNYSMATHHAGIGDGATVDAESISVRANGKDDLPFRYDAIASGQGIGAVSGVGSIAVNVAQNDVAAFVGEGASVTSNSSLDLLVNARRDVAEAEMTLVDSGGVDFDATAGNVTLGILSAGAAGAGGLTLNGDVMTAEVRENASVDVENDVTVHVRGNQNIENNTNLFAPLIGAAFAGSLGATYTNTQSRFTSSIAGDVTSQNGEISVTTDGSSHRDINAVGIGGSIVAGVGGAGALNVSNNQTQALITGGTINSPNNVVVDAIDNSTVIAESDGLAGAILVGGSLGYAANEIGNSVLARISGSSTSVNADNDVLITANSDPTITTSAVSISSAGFAAAGGGASITETSNSATASIAEEAGIVADSVQVNATAVGNPTTTVLGLQGLSLLSGSVMLSQTLVADSAFAEGTGHITTDQMDVVAHATREPQSHTEMADLAVFEGSIGLEAEATGGTTMATIGPGADIQINSDETLNVHATSNDTANPHMLEADIEIFSAGSMASYAEAGSSSVASIAGEIDAPGIDVLADANKSAEARTTAVGVSVVGLEGVIFPRLGNVISSLLPLAIPVSADTESSAVIRGDASAFIGAEADISTSGELSVVADSTNVADATTWAAGISNTEVASAGSYANVLGSTNVYLDEGIALNVGSLTTNANSMNDADARMRFAGIEGVGVEIADLEAITNHETTARLGPGNTEDHDEMLNGSLTVSSGEVELSATSENDARTHQVDVAIGGITIDIVRPVSIARGATRAFAGGNFTSNTDLTLNADADNDATTGAVNVEVSGINVNVDRDTVSTDHVTESFVQGDANLSVNGEFVMNATSENDSRVSQTDALDLSGFQLSIARSQANVDGRTNTNVAQGSNITANEVIVNATATNRAEVDSFNFGAGVLDIGIAVPAALTNHETLSQIGTGVPVEVTVDAPNVIEPSLSALRLDNVELVTGDAIRYSPGTDGDMAAGVINGLMGGGSYFVSVQKQEGSVLVRFHQTHADALNGLEAIPINAMDTSGSSHLLRRLFSSSEEGTITANDGINFTANSTNNAENDEVNIQVGTISIDVVKPNVVAGGTTEMLVGGRWSLTGDLSGVAESVNEASSLAVGIEAVGVDVDLPTRSLRTTHATRSMINTGASVSSVGGLDFTADSVNNAGLTDTSVDVATVAVAVADLTVDVGGETVAGIRRGSEVFGPSAEFIANSTNMARANLVNVGVGAASVDVSISDARTTHSTEAFIGTRNGDSSVDTSVLDIDSLSLLAESDNDAVADVTSVEGGSLVVQVANPTASISGTTTAHVSGSMRLSVVDLDVNANGTSHATTSPTLVGIGGATGQGVVPESTVTHEVGAFLGSRVGESPNASALTSITAAGDVSVRSNGSMTGQAVAGGGGAGGLNVSALLPTSTVSGAVRGYVREDAAIDAIRLFVSAGAPDDPADFSATAESTTVGIAVLNGAGANAVATSGGVVEAFVGSPVGEDAVEVAGHGIQVRDAFVDSFSDMRSDAESNGGSGAAISVGVMSPTARTNGVTRSYLGSQTDLQASRTTLNARAETLRAAAQGDFTSVAIAGGNGANVTSELETNVEAFIVNADITSDVLVDVVAETADSLSTANARLGSGGLLAASGAVAESTNENRTIAYIEDAELLVAQNVLIEANSKDRATSDTRVSGSGLINGSGTHATTNLFTETQSYIGNDVQLTVTEDVQVRAIAETAEGDANASSGGGGGINVGVALADLNVEPTVRAHISGMLDDDDSITTVVNARDVVVVAELREEPSSGPLDDTFNLSSDVNTSDDTIEFSQHGTENGDIVTIDHSGTTIQTPGSLGELQEQREYSVIRVNENQIQLGTVFDGEQIDATEPFTASFGSGGIDPDNDVIVTSSLHNLQTGDSVKYDNRGATPISDTLTPVGAAPDSLETTYYVRRVDDFQFKLATSLVDATTPVTPLPISDGLVSGENTFNLPAHGFSNGDRVTYRAPSQTGFRSINVDLDIEADGTTSEDANNSEANNIYLGQDTNGDGIVEGHNFQDGDRITYQVEDASLAVGGLTNGQSYFVIRNNQFEIQLAQTLCEAIGCPEDEIDVTPISLEPDKTVDDASPLPPGNARHLLVPTTIGALRNGATYTVAGVAANSFRLENDNGVELNLNIGSATGTHTIGVEGIELTPSHSGSEHAIRIDFVGPTPNLNNSLLGPFIGDPPMGSSLRAASPPTGDGVSSVSARGSGGGVFVGIEIPTARTNYNPSVATFIAADQVNADRDLTISSDSQGTVSSFVNSRAGGVIKVGRVNSDVDITQDTNAFVGLPAADVSLDSISGEAETIQIEGGGVNISAENVSISSESSIDTRSTGVARGGGLIATARAEASNDVDGFTNVIIGRDAIIDADTVDLNATVDGVFADAEGEASAGGLFGSSRAVVNNNVISNVHVLLEGTDGDQTQLTGREGIDIEVEQDDIQLERRASSRFFGIGPSPVEGANRTTIDSIVDADPGVLVTAGPRILPVPGVPEEDITPLGTPTTGGISNLALFVDVDGPTDSLGSDDRQLITWEADAEILSGPSPELEIASNGQIVKAINVSVNDGQRTGSVSDTFSVDNIENDDPGDVLFRTNQEDTSAEILNPQVDPNFTFRFTFDEVLITNYSDFTMTVNDIFPANIVERPLIAISAMDEEIPFEFDVDYVWEPTFIQINQLSDASNQVRVNGQIDNPIGRTEFHSTSIAGNSDGEIPVIRVGLNDGGGVRTNDLHITSTRGSYSVEAQLVESEGRPTQFTSVVDHPGTSYLRVQGVLRDESVDDFIVNINSIITPGTMLIDYRKSIQETDPRSATLRTDVNEVPIAQSSIVYDHFRPTGFPGVTLLPVGVFGAGAVQIGSHYDFQFIEADYLRIEPFDGNCSDTNFDVNWNEPGNGVIFDGPGSITLGDNDGDGNSRDILLSDSAVLVAPEGLRNLQGLTGFFGFPQDYDSFTVAGSGSLERAPGSIELPNLTFARSVDVTVGGNGRPFTADTLDLGTGTVLNLEANERFREDGFHRQTVVAVDQIMGEFSNRILPGQHLGRGIFTRDLDGDGQVVERTPTRVGAEYTVELYQAALGDTDGNGEVNFSDFLVLSNAFGREADWLTADFDGDGLASFGDFLILSANFGT